MSPDGQALPAKDDTGKTVPAPGRVPAKPTPGETPSPNALTPAEQMALFEKDLKENDWGHQPC